MMRLIDPVLRRCVINRCMGVACLASLLASSATAENVSFGTRPRYNGVPTAGTNIVVYNLPASGSIYMGPVNASFDLFAQVSGSGTETAAGFGLIATVSGDGQVTFNPPEIVGDANNLFAAQNAAFLAQNNTSFDLMFAETGIQGGGNQEIDITAFEEIGGQNNPISNGQGLASIPIQIAPGATGTYNVAFTVSPTDVFTGFVKSVPGGNPQFLTNSGAFPHTGAAVEVRQSRRGDLNGDVLIDGEDIAPFISVLSNTPAFRASRPWLQTDYITDLNQDTFIDGEDIAGFIAVLSGGASPVASPTAIPEPSSVVLAVLGAAGLFAMRRRRVHGRR